MHRGITNTIFRVVFLSVIRLQQNFVEDKNVVHCELPGPLSGNDIESLPVRVVKFPYLRFHTDLAVRVGQQRLYRDENLGEGEAGHPVPLLDGVDADVSVSVDVWMKYLGEELLMREENLENQSDMLM